jgi:hypothetical protein
MEATMTRLSHRALLIAAAAFMAASPAGWAASDQTAIPDSSRRGSAPMPHAVQAMACGKRTDVVKMLRDTFGETPIAHGLADTGAVAEIFTSSTGTWTIVATAPDGTTCMVGSGQSWRPVVARDGTI